MYLVCRTRLGAGDHARLKIELDISVVLKGLLRTGGVLSEPADSVPHSTTCQDDVKSGAKLFKQVLAKFVLRKTGSSDLLAFAM